MRRRRGPHPYPILAISRRISAWLAIVAVYCLAVGAIEYYWDIKPFEISGEQAVVNSVILGLLLGFRNRIAYDRWWEGRRLWGELVNTSRNLAVKVARFLPVEVAVEARVPDLIPAFSEALKRHLRRQRPRLQDIHGFGDDTADPAHVPLHLVGELYEALARWKRAGLIDEAVLRILDEQLRTFLDVCGGCERILNTPVTPSYKALLRTGIALNLLVSPWYTMTSAGGWGLPAFLLVSFFLLGVELIDTVIEDPFGNDYEDLDLEGYCRTIRESVETSFAAAAEAERNRADGGDGAATSPFGTPTA